MQWNSLRLRTKVDVGDLGTFLLGPIPCRIQNLQLMRDEKQIQDVPSAICFINSRSLMEFFFSTIKVKIPVLIKWSYRLLQPR